MLRCSALAASCLAAGLALTACSGASAGERAVVEPATTPSSAGTTRTTAAPTSTPVTTPTPSVIPATPADTRPRSTPRPLTARLAPGVVDPLVRELQARLRQAKHLAIRDLDDFYDDATTAAVASLQEDRHLPTTGVVDQATWDALLPLTSDPTPAELANVAAGPWYVSPSNPGFVAELQHRLHQVGDYAGAIDGTFSDATRAAITAYRSSIGLEGDVMDERAWVSLCGQTQQPTYADLFASAPTSTLTQQLDPRCTTGAVICISLSQRMLSYVVDGKPLLTRDARFARPGWESYPGDYRMWTLDPQGVSSIFGERVPMPYGMFFDGDVGIHFSDDFVANGYETGSHGCTQLKDYAAMLWLFEHVSVGDRVVVY